MISNLNANQLNMCKIQGIIKCPLNMFDMHHFHFVFGSGNTRDVTQFGE